MLLLHINIKKKVVDFKSSRAAREVNLQMRSASAYLSVRIKSCYKRSSYSAKPLQPLTSPEICLVHARQHNGLHQLLHLLAHAILHLEGTPCA